MMNKGRISIDEQILKSSNIQKRKLRLVW